MSLFADTPGVSANKFMINRLGAGAHAGPGGAAKLLLDACEYGPMRVVLSLDRHPEHRYHGVADVLLDDPAVARPARR